MESITKVTLHVGGQHLASPARVLRAAGPAGISPGQGCCTSVSGSLAQTVIGGYRVLRTLAEARIGEVRHLAAAFFGDVDGVEPVSMDELIARAERGDVLLVDVRPRLECDSGHSSKRE